METPDYVPRTWTRWRINRWFMAKPQRALGWYIAVSAVAVMLIIGALLDDSLRLRIAAVAGVAALVQAAIYAPRAWRAWRANRQR